MYDHSSNFMKFVTNAGERMRIDNAGNMLLGTTSHSTGAFGAATGINIKKPRPQVLLQDTTNNTDGYLGLTTAGLFLATQDALSISFHTSDVERMRITSAGSVGIGITSPEQVFHVYQAGDGKRPVRFTTGNDKDLDFYNDSEGWQLQSQKGLDLRSKGGGTLRFKTGSGSDDSENLRMTIDTDGDVRIGTTSAVFSSGEKMSLLHNGGHGLGIKTSGDVSYQPLALFNNTTGTAVIARFEVGYGPAGAISSNATTTTYGQPSDYRLKENIVPLPSATAKVNALNPVRFNMIANPENTTVDGFIAHEVQEIVPEAVVHQKDAVDEDGNPEYQQMDASKLIPIMVKAIQEQQTIIDDLKSRIETLEE